MDKGLVVSIQGYSTHTTNELADKCINAGAVGIRTDKKIDINKPLIALEKLEGKDYYITTSLESIKRCRWGDYVAIDSRRGNMELHILYATCLLNGYEIIADIENIRDVENILEMYLKKKHKLPAYFATTFSFLTNGHANIELIKDIVSITSVPIIAEGKYRDLIDVIKARQNGASNICIGAEISDIEYLTEKFNKIC